MQKRKGSGVGLLQEIPVPEAPPIPQSLTLDACLLVWLIQQRGALGGLGAPGAFGGRGAVDGLEPFVGQRERAPAGRPPSSFQGPPGPGVGEGNEAVSVALSAVAAVAAADGLGGPSAPHLPSSAHELHLVRLQEKLRQGESRPRRLFVPSFNHHLVPCCALDFRLAHAHVVCETERARK